MPTTWSPSSSTNEGNLLLTNLFSCPVIHKLIYDQVHLFICILSLPCLSVKDQGELQIPPRASSMTSLRPVLPTGTNEAADGKSILSHLAWYGLLSFWSSPGGTCLCLPSSSYFFWSAERKLSTLCNLFCRVSNWRCAHMPLCCLLSQSGEKKKGIAFLLHQALALRSHERESEEEIAFFHLSLWLPLFPKSSK